MTEMTEDRRLLREIIAKRAQNESPEVKDLVNDLEPRQAMKYLDSVQGPAGEGDKQMPAHIVEVKDPDGTRHRLNTRALPGLNADEKRAAQLFGVSQDEYKVARWKHEHGGFIR